jgi:gas vesicle protein
MKLALILSLFVAALFATSKKTDIALKAESDAWHKTADDLAAENVQLRQKLSRTAGTSAGTSASLATIIQQGSDASQAASESSQNAAEKSSKNSDALEQQRKTIEQHTRLLNSLVTSNKTIEHLMIMLVISMLLDLVLVFMIVKGRH